MRKGQCDPPVCYSQRTAFLEPYSWFVFAWEEICHFRNTCRLGSCDHLREGKAGEHHFWP